MTLHWLGPDHRLTGTGDIATFDPGRGDARYSRAAQWLAAADRTLGFASFTFDPDETGSTVLAPQRLGSGPVLGSVPKGARVVSDGRADWEKGFIAMSEALVMERVRKVVLARQVDVALDGPIAIDSIVAHLDRDNRGTYVFAIGGLVGASPELLVSVSSGRLRSVVLAGTSTGSGRLDDPRITMEHDLAADSVAAGLRRHTTSLATSRSVVEVGPIRHVATTFEGEIEPGVGVLDVVATLHPTAAVAGTPRIEALTLIRGHEPRSRGCYAGPVGWFDKSGDGEFAVALRCAQIHDDRATLYAGGGLVAGSDIETEWAETEAKLQPMIAGLGVH
ncbi:MAG: chorismate-binding protein [Actinobacteria bacterium]|nr:chorismate-binding protein [Actinomycetota bacterium]MCI0543719.1 chorismate-binding protein [Actinomycetota bacterium]MCI0679174.1 chorismate-binding protein [Actinomycetota bacterium]